MRSFRKVLAVVAATALTLTATGLGSVFAASTTPTAVDTKITEIKLVQDKDSVQPQNSNGTLIGINETFTFEAVLDQPGAENQVRWTVSDPTKAEIKDSATPEVTGKAAGAVTLTAKLGTNEKTFKLNVAEKKMLTYKVIDNYTKKAPLYDTEVQVVLTSDNETKDKVYFQGTIPGRMTISDDGKISIDNTKDGTIQVPIYKGFPAMKFKADSLGLRNDVPEANKDLTNSITEMDQPVMEASIGREQYGLGFMLVYASNGAPATGLVTDVKGINNPDFGDTSATTMGFTEDTTRPGVYLSKGKTAWGFYEVRVQGKNGMEPIASVALLPNAIASVSLGEGGGEPDPGADITMNVSFDVTPKDASVAMTVGGKNVPISGKDGFYSTDVTGKAGTEVKVTVSKTGFQTATKTYKIEAGKNIADAFSLVANPNPDAEVTVHASFRFTPKDASIVMTVGGKNVALDGKNGFYKADITGKVGTEVKVTVSRTGYYTATKTYKIEAGKNISDTFSLEPTSSSSNNGSSSGGSSSGSGQSYADKVKGNNQISTTAGNNIPVKVTVNASTLQKAPRLTNGNVLLPITSDKAYIPITSLKSAIKSLKADEKIVIRKSEKGAVLYQIVISPIEITNANKTADIKVGMTKNYQPTFTYLNKYFSNIGEVIRLEQRGSFGIEVEVAVKVDPSKFNKGLNAYVLDPATNNLTTVSSDKVFLDKNGYAHVKTDMGGDIVFSNGSLKK